MTFFVWQTDGSINLSINTVTESHWGSSVFSSGHAVVSNLSEFIFSFQIFALLFSSIITEISILFEDIIRYYITDFYNTLIIIPYDTAYLLVQISVVLVDFWRSKASKNSKHTQIRDPTRRTGAPDLTGSPNSFQHSIHCDLNQHWLSEYIKVIYFEISKSYSTLPSYIGNKGHQLYG